MVINNLDKLYFVAKCVLINDENKILILKRSDYKNDGTGDLWDLPGGNVDLYEDINLTIIREVKEETNIDLNETNIFGIDSCKHAKQEAQVIFVLFASKSFDMNKIKLSEEHIDYKWISIQDIDNFNLYLTKKRIDMIKNYLKY